MRRYCAQWYLYHSHVYLPLQYSDNRGNLQARAQQSLPTRISNYSTQTSIAHNFLWDQNMVNIKSSKGVGTMPIVTSLLSEKLCSNDIRVQLRVDANGQTKVLSGLPYSFLGHEHGLKTSLTTITTIPTRLCQRQNQSHLNFTWKKKDQIHQM